MSYDHWKTTNPMDAELGSADQGAAYSDGRDPDAAFDAFVAGEITEATLRRALAAVHAPKEFIAKVIGEARQARREQIDAIKSMGA